MSKKLKFPSLILLAGALASPIGVYADVLPDRQSVNISQQSGKVTGVVEDALGPVIGASVVIKGTTNGIMTDLDGKFTLDNVKKGQVLQISFVGYKTKEIAYTGQTTMKILLEEDSQALDEVVVTALGMSRDKKSLGYAMTELKGDEIAKVNSPNRSMVCKVRLPVYRLTWVTPARNLHNASLFVVTPHWAVTTSRFSLSTVLSSTMK